MEIKRFQKIWVFYMVATILALFSLFNLPHFHLGNLNVFAGSDRGTLASSTPIIDSKTPEIRVQRIAWAIPVGGHTKRNDKVRMLIRQLLASGAPHDTIFIFEDDSSRAHADADLDKIAEVYHINLHRTRVPRFGREASFGLFLARHYKKMFTTIFSGNPRAFDFIVFIEDDLVMAPDAVAYFTAMSFIMEHDPTIFCVSAHNDNAIPANSINENSKVDVSKTEQFLFRRGEHFMAPGWMTSATIYHDVISPGWLDRSGNLLESKSLNMPNGNWDAYMEARMKAGPSGNFTHFAGMDLPLECIYPELPRVSHVGGGGYTVSNAAQMTYFENLLLSQYDPKTQLEFSTIVDDLGSHAYEKRMKRFINSAVVLNSMAEVALYRRTTLVLPVSARHDNDNIWRNVLTGKEGFELLVGVGGHAGFGKPRGVHRGTVFVRRLTNILLLVAQYSEYALLLPTVEPRAVVEGVKHMGCTNDKGDLRELPHFISDTLAITGLPITPRTCVIACMDQGFSVAGIQFGNECWCGENFGSYGTVDQQLCNTCKVVDVSFQCGGPLLNSIYLPTKELINDFNPSDTRFESAAKQQSCDSACELRGQVCDPQLLPLLSLNCKVLKNMFGCDQCSHAKNLPHGWATPGFDVISKKCVLSKTHYLRCDYAPKTEFRRACVCVS